MDLSYDVSYTFVVAEQEESLCSTYLNRSRLENWISNAALEFLYQGIFTVIVDLESRAID